MKLNELEVELKRQSLHIILGLFFITLVLLFPLEEVVLLTFFIFLIGTLAATALAHGVEVAFLEDVLKHVQRKHEDFPGEGALFFVFGILLLFLLFSNQKVVLGALIVLTFYDSFSVLIGKRFGNIKLVQNYTLEGCLGGIVAAFIPLFFLFNPLIAIVGGITAAIAELLPINDSISIPILVALVLSLLL